jgi:Putative transposase/Transposase zinc-binding domain
MREGGQAREASEYSPRRPETTILYRVVQHHLETWLGNARNRERTVPRFVERELRAFLDCGILANGFLRLHCDACGVDRVVPFSCKGRGFCPSCGGRHMADTAAHLVDRVLPRAPVRQWVLSLPFGLRYRLANDRELTADVLRIFVRAVFTSLRRRSRPERSGSGSAHAGAVTFVQRFGGALNLNLHFHMLVLDGTYRPSGNDPRLRFHPAPPPTSNELEWILQRTLRGLVRVIERRGLGDEPDRLAEDDPLLAQLLAAAVQGRAATGPRAGQRVLRFGDRVEIQSDEMAVDEKMPGLARSNGFSLHAGVAVPANDRQRLERLCRYVGRPPVASERLSELADGRLLYELRHRWRDGTTHVAFEPLELIDRLAALVPPPRFHTVRYHGVLASRSKRRAQVVPRVNEPAARASCGVGACVSGSRTTRQPSDLQSGSPDWTRTRRRVADRVPGRTGAPTEPASAPAGSSLAHRERVTHRSSRPSRYYSWSELMRRVFAIDVLRCPRCRASPMRILAAIHPPATTRAILKSLGLPTRAPPIAPAQPVPEDWSLAEPSANRYRAGPKRPAA